MIPLCCTCTGEDLSIDLAWPAAYWNREWGDPLKMPSHGRWQYSSVMAPLWWLVQLPVVWRCHLSSQLCEDGLHRV